MIVITGASGLLGSSLVALAHEQSREIMALCRRPLPHLEGVKQALIDLTDESKIRDLLRTLKPSAVIHCAAETNVDGCQDHPGTAEAINVTGARRIAEACAQINARMLYISTDSVFDGARGNYSEGDATGPLNVYAATKLRGEMAVLNANPLTAVARVTLYGWSPRQRGLAEWIFGQLSSGCEVPGFVDAVFCPLLANDLAEILFDMMDRGLSGLYHVVGSEAVSKFEFARCLASTFGLDPSRVTPARLSEAQLRAPRPPNTSLNTTKISGAIGRSMPDLDSGLLRFAQLRHSGYAARLKGMLTEARV
ncbi:MAG TPA: SDR family oxidoreductase [Candidatus Sulfotelmatobacter sp.]|nr:SDR family oxidoreductase [Candidatus Sulfotelmatobacter sp.]